MKREEEKALEEAQKKAPHPEPFEVKRQAAMVQKPGESRTMQPQEPAKSRTMQPSIYKSEAVYGKIAESRAEPEPEIQAVAPVESQKPEQKQPQQLDLFEEKLLEPKNRIRHKLIGQLFDTYWLVEFNEHLYIIDQHAAHEKVLYEKTMQTLKTREFTSQMLNPPIILTIGSTEEVLLKKYMKYFQDIGFEIEPFGGREYAVRAVPDNLFSVAKKELLMEMIDDLSEDAGARTADMIHDRVATMSCKAAVKGNNHLSFAEADHLIDELLNLDNPYACPHGRPTIISMSRYELEKKFKRIV